MKETKIPVSSGPDMPSVQEIEAETAEGTTGNQAQPREYPTRQRRMWDWISGRHGHIRDWLVAGFTLALTIATIFYVHYAGQQRDAMIEAVRESKRASDAAEKAVEIAEQTRRNSETFAKETTDRAERATKATENAARSMASQADAFNRSANSQAKVADAVERSTDIAKQAMTTGTRAYVGIHAIQANLITGGIRIFFENVGKVPADDIKVYANSVIQNGETYRTSSVVREAGHTQLFPGPFYTAVTIPLKDFVPDDRTLILTGKEVISFGLKVRPRALRLSLQPP